MYQLLTALCLALLPTVCNAQIQWDFFSTDGNNALSGQLTTEGTPGGEISLGSSFRLLSVDSVFNRIFVLGDEDEPEGGIVDLPVNWRGGAVPPFSNAIGFVDVLGVDGLGTTSFLSATDATEENGIFLDSDIGMFGEQSYVINGGLRQNDISLPRTIITPTVPFTVSIPEPSMAIPAFACWLFALAGRRRKNACS
jgi:hypothetical protein